jgi:hypothetical protein
VLCRSQLRAQTAHASARTKALLAQTLARFDKNASRLQVI